MLAELDELDSSSGWVPFFQKLNWIAKSNAGPQKAAKIPENRLFNRYRDVLPYDHSRVVLKEGETDYINANLVEVPTVNRRYILTQGPLKNTVAHFWQMVWEQKTQAIIMLNRVIEKNQIKCHQYWPCGEKVGHTDVMEVGHFRITYIEESMSEFFTVRTLEIFNMKEEEKRNIFHFHYLHWPDFGVPASPATFLSFLFEARNAGVLSSDVGPSVIHCSAGIGRSGTFILVDSILKEVEQTQDLINIDVKKALLEIRRYRVGLIQTPDQLRFTYAAILEGTRMLMPQVYEEALDKFLNEREPEEEEEVPEEDEVPPPVPARKRQEVDQSVDKEANIAPKRKRSLPDIPGESTSAAAETPKETSADATPKETSADETPDTSKGISSYQGFQEDNVSSDESDGEDEIIDLSASSSSSPEDEESEEDIERLETKAELTTAQDDERYAKESEEQDLRGETAETEEGSSQTEISHKTKEETIEMEEEEEELQAGLEDQEVFSKLEPETTQEVKKVPMERERETTFPLKVMDSKMVEIEEISDKTEDKKDFAKPTEETAKTGKAKDKKVRKEKEKKIDAGKAGGVSKEMEGTMDESEDLFDRLEDREMFAKKTSETMQRAQVRDQTEDWMKREKKLDTGISTGVSKEIEGRMGETKDLFDRLEDREMYAKRISETMQRDQVRETEDWMEREKKLDTGISTGVSKEIKGRMGETKDLYDRLEDREMFAKRTSETVQRDQVRDQTEDLMEREKKIDGGKSRVSKETERRMHETEDFYEDIPEDKEVLGKRIEETPWKDKEVRKEREKAVITGESRAGTTDMERRMDETEDFYEGIPEDRGKFVRTTEETAWRDQAEEPDIWMERERTMDAGKYRMSRDMERRMDETEDLHDNRIEYRDEIEKTREETARRGQGRDREVRMEREKKIDTGKYRMSRDMDRGRVETEDLYKRLEDREVLVERMPKTAQRDQAKEPERTTDAEKYRMSRDMEQRTDETKDLYDDRIEYRDKFAKTAEETAWRGKVKDREVRMEREKKIDAGKFGAVIQEMKSRMDRREDFYDRLEDREMFEKPVEETVWRGQARDRETEEMYEKLGDGNKFAKGLPETAWGGAVESRMDESEHLHDKLEDKEVYARRTPEMAWRQQAKEPEVLVERERIMDTGKHRMSSDMERRMKEPEAGYDKFECGDKIAKTLEETTLRDKAKEPEVWMERERPMDAGKHRMSREMDRRRGEPKDLYERLEDKEVLAERMPEMAWREQAKEPEVWMERERTMDTGQYRISRDMERRRGEPKDLYEGLEDREVLAERTPEMAWREQAKEPEVWNERERTMDTGQYRISRDMERRRGEPKDLYERLEDREVLAERTPEMAWRGQAKEPEVWMERERTIDTGQYRISRDMERRRGEPKDLYEGLQDREVLAERTPEVAWRGQAKEPEVWMERERTIDTGQYRISRDMERRRGEPKDLYEGLQDREVLAERTPETAQRGKAEEPDVWMERERTMDTGQYRMSRDMERRIDETEDLHDDRIEYIDKFAKPTEGTTQRDKEEEREVWNERERTMDTGKYRMSSDMERRRGEPEAAYDRFQYGDTFARTAEETTLRAKAEEPDILMERERPMDAGKHRMSRDIERRMGETKDLSKRLEDREVLAERTPEMAWREQAKEPEVWNERERTMDTGQYRMSRDMERRIDETKDLHDDRIEYRDKFAKTTEGTTQRDKAEEPEVWNEKLRERTMDAGKYRMSRDMDRRMGEPEDLYERLEDREVLAERTPETAQRGKAKEPDVWMERERTIDAEKYRMSRDVDRRRGEPEAAHDKFEYGDKFARKAEETTLRDKAEESEVWMEKERTMDVEEYRMSRDMDRRRGEPKAAHDKFEYGDKFARKAEETTLRDKAEESEVWMEKERTMDAEEYRMSRDMDRRRGEPEAAHDKFEYGDKFARKAEETTLKAEESEVWMEKERTIDAEKYRMSRDMDRRIEESKDLYGDRIEDKDKFAKTTEETTQRGQAKEPDSWMEKERTMDAGQYRMSRDMERRMDEMKDLTERLEDRDKFAKTTKETTWRGQAKEREVRMERETELDTGTPIGVSKEMKDRMHEMESTIDEREKCSDKTIYGEEFSETELRKETDQIMEAEGKRMLQNGRQTKFATEIAIQTSIPFMEEDKEMLVEKEHPSSEDTKTLEEEELIRKESIGIQACVSDDIIVKIDSDSDRRTESKEIPSSKLKYITEKGKENELISKEDIERIAEKEEVKEVISSSVETRSSEKEQVKNVSSESSSIEAGRTEQKSDFKKEKIVDKSENIVKTEDKSRKVEAGKHKVNLTGPALILEKMNAIKIQKDVISKPVPEPMESGSDIMESEHGAYAHITKAEKLLRSGNEPSNESIGGSIGTNPRKSDHEIQSKEKKVGEVKSPDEIPPPSITGESATELRRRQRQEKKEKTEKLVKDIKDRVKYEEDTRWIRKIIRNSLIVLGVCAAAYIAYRCYRYFFRIPRRKFRRF